MIDRLDVLERLSNPEYTGENRCLPCTVVNVALAIAIATVLAFVFPTPVGVAVLGLSFLTIWLRGYLVPGTPALTRRYFPAWLLAAFDKAPAERPTIEIESADLEAAVETLASGGVVIVDEDEVRLTPEFRYRWNDRLEAFRTDTAAAADTATDGRAPDTSNDPDWQPPGADDVAAMFDVGVERRGDAFELEGSKRLRWDSDAALAADVAADRELGTRLEGWTSLDLDDRRDVLAGLRLLRDRCPVPVCDGHLSRTVERLEHCCRRPRIGLESTCEACGRPIAIRTVPEGSPLLEWMSAGRGQRAPDA